MSGTQVMVIVIVAIVMIASVIKARGHGPRSRSITDEHSENLRLREEVKDLKERIQVLERITTDRENTLSREIEELRDR